MKFALFLIVLTSLSLSVLSQPKTSTKKPGSVKANAGRSTTAKKAVAAPTVKKDEKTELENALAIQDPGQRITALTQFLEDFPKSESRSQVIESLTAVRISAAQMKADAGERDAALTLLRKALEEAPTPYPEKLFADSISKVPMLMYLAGGVAPAYEAAATVEKNLAPDAPQFLALANFYLNLENGAEAKRLAEAALKLDERSSAAYQTLGMANRVNFDLEASTAAYEKAVELDPESVSARQSLAEMKRAIGKPDEAAAIFSSLIEKDPNDLRSINGRILALFDAGKRTEAEAEFAKLTEADSAGFILLSGVSYWYAANGEHAKAIDLAGKAIAAEPRYIWSHIALARALSAAGRFTDAEQVLLKARQYGNFPTLDYELAAAKFNSGFYREAAEQLQKSFAIKDGAVVTKLGRRIDRSEKNFIELLSAERRAGIFEPKAADSIETAQKMKALLELTSILVEKSADEAKAAEAAAAFADGTDKMRFHRQIFAANQLAYRSLAPAKVLELTKAAVSSVDDGLNVPAPAAPIMASELYASRTEAIASDKYVLVPDVPKQTLSAIARGRIEELAGIALMQQKNNAEAALRFRRAVSILPDKSAWWRSTHWRLGTALEAEGKDKEALDAYVKSYSSGDPDGERYAVIENVYKRLNSGTEGLEALVGTNPVRPEEKKTTEPAASTIAEPKTEAPSDTKTNASAEIKAEPVKKAGTTETKLSEAAASPPKENENPKSSGTPSPSTSPESKQVVEEKVQEQKATEGSAKSIDAAQKPDEDKTKPGEEPPAKVLEKNEQPTKLEEKKVENTTDARLSSVKKVEVNKTESKAPETPVEDKKAEPKASETKVDEIRPDAKVPENKSDENKRQVTPPETRTDESKAETKPPDATVDEKKAGSKPTLKPLFEPVVIEIKSSKPAKTAASTPQNQVPSSETPAEGSGASRARVVTGKDVAADIGPQCSLSVSQSNISLISGKGSIGILVAVDGGDIKDVTSSSSSPKDVDVAPDPALAGLNGQTLFVIRSLTDAAGEYKVNFTSPCGKKEVRVRVR